MNWIYLIIGFLAFPIIALLVMLLIKLKSMVHPILISQTNELQNCIKDLYQNGKKGDQLFIQDRVSEFTIRVIKMERKVKKNTLRIEIRASGKNSDSYNNVKETLKKENVAFEEKLTPKLKKPSRIFIKNDSGGIFTVSSVSQIINKIMCDLSNSTVLDVLLSNEEPHFWKQSKTTT